MDINASQYLSTTPNISALRPETTKSVDDAEVRKQFDNFVGQTFFGQLLKSMRKTLDKPAFFHGGHAEEVFQAQLDQVLAERMTQSSASQFSGPMYDLFRMQRH